MHGRRQRLRSFFGAANGWHCVVDTHLHEHKVTSDTFKKDIYLEVHSATSKRRPVIVNLENELKGQNGLEWVRNIELMMQEQ